MADFVQTMKDWRRMCKVQDDTICGACSSCPMGDDGKSCAAVYEDEFDAVDFAHIEQTVAEWAAEHPEPVYPTWAEWLAENGAFGPLKGIKTDFTETEILCRMREMMFDPIPADLAQKLGLQPKEV